MTDRTRQQQEQQMTTNGNQKTEAVNPFDAAITEFEIVKNALAKCQNDLDTANAIKQSLENSVQVLQKQMSDYQQMTDIEMKELRSENKRLVAYTQELVVRLTVVGGIINDAVRNANKHSDTRIKNPKETPDTTHEKVAKEIAAALSLPVATLTGPSQ